MLPLDVWSICATLTIAFASAAAVTLAARYLAPRVGMMDRPDGRRKQHLRQTPLLGGISIPMAVVSVLVYLWASSADVAAAWLWLPADLLWLTVSACLLCAVGVCDDRRPIRARVKFAAQMVAVTPFVIYSGPVDSISFFGVSLYLGPAGYLFAAFWLIGCVNAMNLLDGVDGLAALTSAVVLFGIAVLATLTGNLAVGWYSAVCAMAVAGFLVHNLPPAKIFLGDAGSMTLGLLIGGLMLAAPGGNRSFNLIEPLALMALPFLDTGLSMLRRKLIGRGIGAPDRLHIHHRMQDCGWSTAWILRFAGGASVLLLGSAIAGRICGSDIIPLTGALLMTATLWALNVACRHEWKLLRKAVSQRFTARAASAAAQPQGIETPPRILPFTRGASVASADATKASARKAA